jgi:predicted DsbA family dithiol-disulfide isomerase
MRLTLAFGVVSVLGVVFVALLDGCRGTPAGDPSAATGDVELPGVETRGFTPREKHEFSRYVAELGAPCPGVAVPIAQCILERRACPSCLPAAIAIAKAVREGMAREQVEGLYKQRFDVSSAKSIPIDGSPARGSDGATVTIVEFADFECPFCQHIAPQLDDLWEKKKPNLRFVFKFMPLAMHPRGEPAARAAIAAQAQGKFWEMHHQLFANGQHLEESDIDAYAKAMGMDLGRFHSDMQSPATKARLDADRKLADDLGVKGTPTIFINGRLYDGKGDIADWVDGEIAGGAGK